MVNRNGGDNILTTAAEGRAAGVEARTRVLHHAMELSGGGRRNEVMGAVMRGAVEDPHVMALTCARLDVAMNGVSHHRAVKLIHEIREGLHDSTVKSDGFLTLGWVFDLEDRGCRLGAWLYAMSGRGEKARMQPPDDWPWRQVFEPDEEDE